MTLRQEVQGGAWSRNGIFKGDATGDVRRGIIEL